MTDSTDKLDSQTPPRRRGKHFVWIGPLVCIAAIASFLALVPSFPPLRDHVWIPLAFLAGGAVFSVLGARALLAARRSVLRWVMGVGSVLFSAGIGVFFACGIFVFTKLPARAEVRLPDSAVSFELADATGTKRHANEFRGKKLVLVFYRGHW